MSDRPRILAVATAVPPHRLAQSDVREWARRLFADHAGDIERLLPAFDNAGIEVRYSCVPLSWYDGDHGWRDKNELYLGNALDLAETAATRCLQRAGLDAADVGAVVCVSTSGIATPSLDARLISRLGLRPEVQRMPLFGLGCVGGVLGLARAAELAARPGRHVLLLVTELCGLTFRRADLSKSNVIATALFGDGAAAALVSTDGDGAALTGWGEHTWPDTLGVMGWSVEDDGLGVIFSRDIPALVRRDLPAVVDAYLGRQGLELGAIDGFICHPGGAKVVAALEDVFGLEAGGLKTTREVLRDYGNMSAASVMFVLERTLANGASGAYLICALGPGFTAGLATIECR
ncbi:MAG: type III polyketide synthase [Gammaproteobacteria bacterium]|nr:MAG: type III polyketide synthase [Gammaproteobacteria bacterium]